jgi:hypothetical protein
MRQAGGGRSGASSGNIYLGQMSGRTCSESLSDEQNCLPWRHLAALPSKLAHGQSFRLTSME